MQTIGLNGVCAGFLWVLYVTLSDIFHGTMFVSLIFAVDAGFDMIFTLFPLIYLTSGKSIFDAKSLGTLNQQTGFVFVQALFSMVFIIKKCSKILRDLDPFHITKSYQRKLKSHYDYAPYILTKEWRKLSMAGGVGSRKVLFDDELHHAVLHHDKLSPVGFDASPNVENAINATNANEDSQTRNTTSATPKPQLEQYNDSRSATPRRVTTTETSIPDFSTVNINNTNTNNNDDNYNFNYNSSPTTPHTRNSRTSINNRSQKSGLATPSRSQSQRFGFGKETDLQRKKRFQREFSQVLISGGVPLSRVDSEGKPRTPRSIKQFHSASNLFHNKDKDKDKLDKSKQRESRTSTMTTTIDKQTVIDGETQTLQVDRQSVASNTGTMTAGTDNDGDVIARTRTESTVIEIKRPEWVLEQQVKRKGIIGGIGFCLMICGAVVTVSTLLNINNAIDFCENPSNGIAGMGDETELLYWDIRCLKKVVRLFSNRDEYYPCDCRLLSMPFTTDKINHTIIETIMEKWNLLEGIRFDGARTDGLSSLPTWYFNLTKERLNMPFLRVINWDTLDIAYIDPAIENLQNLEVCFFVNLFNFVC